VGGDARSHLSAGEGRRPGPASWPRAAPTPWPLRHLRWWIAKPPVETWASAGPGQRGGRWPVRSNRVRASSALRLPRATRPTSGIPPRRSLPSSWRGRQPALGGTPTAHSAATPRPSLAPAPASSHSLTSAGVSQPVAHSRAYRSASSRGSSESQWCSCGRAGACISSFARGATGGRGFRPAVRLGRGGKAERGIRTDLSARRRDAHTLSAGADRHALSVLRQRWLRGRPDLLLDPWRLLECRVRSPHATVVLVEPYPPPRRGRRTTKDKARVDGLARARPLVASSGQGLHRRRHR
jgi:hypothetical protein